MKLRLILVFCGLALCGCSTAKKLDKNKVPIDYITVVFTGSELGHLKPIKEGGKKLGGIAARGAVFNEVPKPGRLIVHTGSLIQSQSKQDLMKFSIFIRGLAMLDYDVVNLTANDIAAAQKFELLDQMNGFFNVIISHRIIFNNNSAKSSKSQPKANFSRSFQLSGKNFKVYIGTLSVLLEDQDTKRIAENMAGFTCCPEISAIEGIYDLFNYLGPGEGINILIVNSADENIIQQIQETQLVDAVVVTAKSDKPELISPKDAQPLVFSVGKYGKYAVKLKVTLDDSGRAKLAFSDSAVTEDMPRNEKLTELCENYDRMIKKANLPAPDLGK
jgi:hypothetical protein